MINDVVYAELAVRYDRIESLEAFVDQAALEMAPMPCSAACSHARHRSVSQLLSVADLDYAGFVNVLAGARTEMAGQERPMPTTLRPLSD
jgi:hypothetical protein